MHLGDLLLPIRFILSVPLGLLQRIQCLHIIPEREMPFFHGFLRIFVKCVPLTEQQLHTEAIENQIVQIEEQSGLCSASHRSHTEQRPPIRLESLVLHLLPQSCAGILKCCAVCLLHSKSIVRNFRQNHLHAIATHHGTHHSLLGNHIIERLLCTGNVQILALHLAECMGGNTAHFQHTL